MSVANLADPQGRLQAIDSFPFDAFETGLLSVARYLFDALRCPETQAWHQAYSIASERWGDSIGLPAAHLLARFLRCVVHARDSGFDHLDPFCEHSRGYVSSDEVDLLYVIHFMRRDDTSMAREAVDVLTEGKLDPDVIRAGLTFANRFPAGTAQNERASGVKLRVIQ